MAYFECIIGGAGDGDILTVTCDERFAGLPITCTKGIESYTQTCPLTSPYEVVFEDTVGGTWTISGTIGSRTYSTTVEIIDTFTAELDAGFSWEEWLTLGGLDPTDYNSLDEVLADERALRRLMTVHASVDYMCENEDDTETLEIILGNDLAAKWINLRDYALDSLYAVPAIATIMDNAGKYGYGEWALMPQVPKMTSNTAPYYSLTGTEDSSGQHYLWHAFDRNDSTFWNNGSTANDCYLIVDFGKSIEIKQVSIKPRFVSGHSFVKNFTISASDDGTTWGEPLLSGTHTDSANTENFTIPNSSKHRYWRIRKDGNNYTDTTIQILELQFYAWQPKGCIPKMTANDAPYGWASASSTYSGYDAWKAFDKDANTLWGAGTATYPINLQYRFVNPVCAKRAYIFINDNNGGSRVSTWKIQGSNTGGANDWTDLTDTLNHSYVSGGEYVEIKKNDVYNSNYYAYYRAYFITGSYAPYVRELQLYGRTLNVSVPKMTSNTAPYGEASASSEISESNRKAWNAFDNDSSTLWLVSAAGSPQTNMWIQYEFPREVKALKAAIEWNSAVTNVSGVIRGSNTGDNDDWTDLATITDKNVRDYTLSATEGYRIYRLFISSQSLSSSAANCGRVNELQFYGVDYSEREFATGANMKYLYDHGLELETFTYNTNNAGCVAQNTNERIEISVPAATQRVASALTEIDLANYSLFRGKVGEQVITTAIMRVMSSLTPSPTDPTAAIATYNVGDANLPNNCALGISTFNQSYAVGIVHGNNTGSTASKSTWKELWLE